MSGKTSKRGNLNQALKDWQGCLRFTNQSKQEENVLEKEVTTPVWQSPLNSFSYACLGTIRPFQTE